MNQAGIIGGKSKLQSLAYKAGLQKKDKGCCQKVSRKTKQCFISERKKKFQRRGNSQQGKGIFGIRENEDLKVTLGFGDQEIITDLNKSNFSEQELNVNG